MFEEATSPVSTAPSTTLFTSPASTAPSTTFADSGTKQRASVSGAMGAMGADSATEERASGSGAMGRANQDRADRSSRKRNVTMREERERDNDRFFKIAEDMANSNRKLQETMDTLVRTLTMALLPQQQSTQSPRRPQQSPRRRQRTPKKSSASAIPKRRLASPDSSPTHHKSSGESSPVPKSPVYEKE